MCDHFSKFIIHVTFILFLLHQFPHSLISQAEEAEETQDVPNLHIHHPPSRKDAMFKVMFPRC